MLYNIAGRWYLVVSGGWLLKRQICSAEGEDFAAVVGWSAQRYTKSAKHDDDDDDDSGRVIVTRRRQHVCANHNYCSISYIAQTTCTVECGSNTDSARTCKRGRGREAMSSARGPSQWITTVRILL